MDNIPATYTETGAMDEKHQRQRVPKLKYRLFTRIRNLWKKIRQFEQRIALSLVALLVGLYTIIFSAYTILLHKTLSTQAFDLGIFDQVVWLVSRGKTPFSTVRGMHRFGDHVEYILYLLAPLYWVWDDVRALLILQSLALALGALPVYWIARDKLRSVWLALIVAAVYLLYPALQNLNLDHAHAEAFVTPLLLFAVWAIMRERYLLYGVLCFIALLCKEDVSITLFALGLYVFFLYNRRVGVATCAISGFWVFLSMMVIIPHFTEAGFYRFSGGYSFSQFYANMFNLPWYMKIVFNAKVGQYLARLLFPLAFLPLLNPAGFLLAVPAIAINILSGTGYLISINYHYETSIIPFLFIATISGLSFLRRSYPIPHVSLFQQGKRFWPFSALKFKLRKAPLGVRTVVPILLLLTATLIANSLWSGLPLIRTYQKISERVTLLASPRYRSVEEVLRLIPRDAVVSADYLFVPHLTHREKIYMFPNPFRAEIWGVNDQNTHDPNTVQYILANRFKINSDKLNKELIDALLKRGLFTEIYSANDVLLYQRISTEPRNIAIVANLLPNPTGADGFIGWTAAGGKSRWGIVLEDQGATAYWRCTWVEARSAYTVLESASVPVRGSQVHTLSADFWTGGQTQGTVKMRVDWYDKDLSLVSEGSPVNAAIGVSTWSRQWVSVMAPAQAAYAKVKLVLDNFPQTTETRFGRIKLEEGVLPTPFQPVKTSSGGG